MEEGKNQARERKGKIYDQVFEAISVLISESKHQSKLSDTNHVTCEKSFHVLVLNAYLYFILHPDSKLLNHLQKLHAVENSLKVVTMTKALKSQL